MWLLQLLMYIMKSACKSTTKQHPLSDARIVIDKESPQVSCNKSSVIGALPRFDGPIESVTVKMVKKPHVYKVTVGNSLLYAKISCRPAFKWAAGSHGYAALLAFLTWQFFDMGVPIPCTASAIFTAQSFLKAGLDKRCVFVDHRFGGEVVAAAVFASIPGLQNHDEIVKQWMLPYFTSRRSVGSKEKLNFADVSALSILDYLFFNTDRALPKNQYVWEGRPVAVDNGFFGSGHESICVQSKFDLTCPFVFRMTKKEGKFTDCFVNNSTIEFCMFSKDLALRFLNFSSISFLSFMEKYYLQSHLIDLLEHQFDSGRIGNVQVLLDRKIDQCPEALYSYSTPKEVFRNVVLIVIERILAVKDHMASCIQKSGQSYALQL